MTPAMDPGRVECFLGPEIADSGVMLTVPKVDEWLNSNHRGHWAVRARVTKAWRNATHFAAVAAKSQPFEGRVRITVTFHKARGGRWDPANLYPVAKACVDGLVQAGVLADDDHTHVIGPDMRAGEPRPDAPGVTIEIREDTT